MDVFSAFPNAIISGNWQISECQRGTLTGAVWNSGDAINLDVIVEEGDTGNIASGTNAEPLVADLLMYAKPDQLPTLNTRKLVGGYYVYDGENDDYYDIIRADVGKNQENGKVEHIELYLRQTDVFGVQ